MFEKRTPAEMKIEQGFLLVHLNAGTNGKPQACGMDCLADVALQLIQALLSVILGDNGAAGVDELLQGLTVNSLYSSLNRLVAHVIAELGDIHAERTVLDGGDSGGIAVKAAHDGIGIRLLSINAEKLHFSQ